MVWIGFRSMMTDNEILRDIMSSTLSYDTKRNIIKNLLNVDTQLSSDTNRTFKEVELKNIKIKHTSNNIKE